MPTDCAVQAGWTGQALDERWSRHASPRGLHGRRIEWQRTVKMRLARRQSFHSKHSAALLYCGEWMHFPVDNESLQYQ